MAVLGTLASFSPERTFENSLKTHKNDLQCVQRSVIAARAQNWIDNHVPYNQEGMHDGYRTDSSGFVSMAWALAKPGLTTANFHTVSHNIGKEAIL